MGEFLPCWDLDNRGGFPHRHFHMGRARVPQTGERGAYHLGVSIPSPRGGAIMAASNPLHRVSKQGTGCTQRTTRMALPHQDTSFTLSLFLYWWCWESSPGLITCRPVLAQRNVTLGLSPLHVKAQGHSLLLRILPFPELPGHCHKLRVPFLSVSLAHL